MPRNASPTTLTLNQIGAFCSEWSESTLQEACQLVTDGTHDSPKEVSKGFPLVTGKCIKGGRLSIDAAYLISEADHKKVISRSRAIKGDLLFANIGNSAGEVCLINEEVDISIKNLALFRPSKQLDGVFLLAYLRSRRVQNYIRNTILGSAQPFMGLGTLRGFPVPLPPITEQRAIAHILGTLDDKIELNRKTNETLEEIAKALFKSWFVDFDPVRAKAEGRPTGLPAEISDLFPDSFEDSELGQIPSGWEIKAISNLCQSISSGGTPSRKNSEYWIGGTISWFKTGELRDSFLLESEERITQAGLNESSCKYFDKGDILFALYGATVGKMGIVTAPSTANQAAACLRPLEEVGTPFLEGMLYATRERLMNIATGAAQQNLYLGVVKEHAVVAPCKPLPKMFSQLVEPINQRRLCCLKESSSLSSFGNALLPKLISGEIRIPDAEKMLEEVDI